MTEQEMDRVLAEALTAEPSPDFLARVRAQVAAEPTPARWNRWWPAAVAGVAAIALFVSGGLQTNDGAAPQPVGAGVVASGDGPATSSASTPASTSVEQVPGAPGVARIAEARAVASPPSRPSFPEALIAPEDTRAIVLLLASTSQDVGTPARDESTSVPLTVTRIDLSLINVEPLAALTQISQGELQ